MRIKDLSNGSLTQASSTYLAIDSSASSVTNKISYNNFAVHLLGTFTLTLAGVQQSVRSAINALNTKIRNVGALEESSVQMGAQESTSGFSLGTGTQNTHLVVASNDNGNVSAAFITIASSVYNKVDLLSDPGIVISIDQDDTSHPVKVHNTTGYAGRIYKIKL